MGFGGGKEIQISTSRELEMKPAVAACSQVNKYLVAWEWVISPTMDHVIYARYIYGDDTLGVSISFSIVANINDEGPPDVTCNFSGRQNMLAWSGVGPNSVISGNIFQYNLYDSFNSLITPIDGGWQPAVAGCPISYFVAYTQKRNLWVNIYDIYGVMVTPFVNFIPAVWRK